MDIIIIYYQGKFYSSIENLEELLGQFIKTKILTDYPYGYFYEGCNLVFTFKVKPKEQYTEICLVGAKDIDRKLDLSRFIGLYI